LTARAAEHRRAQETEYRRRLEQQAERASRNQAGDSPAKIRALAQIRALLK